MPEASSSPFAVHWDLDPQVTFLNHGSFGACPRAVLDEQARLRAELEREPVRFLWREIEPRLDAARAALAAFVGADADDLVFVPNATTGVSTVLRSLALVEGDELLFTDHGYNACRNALERVAARAGARVVVATVPFPLDGADAIVEAVLARVTPRTRFALLDHVTSPTGLVFPVARIATALAARGIDVMVDGAHAPGMLPLDLRALGAAGVAYYTGNCHKWLCTPKGSALLWVRRDGHDAVEPLVVSHGWNDLRTARARFRLLFDWTGTADPTPWLAIPAAIEFMGSLLPGGWPALMERNRALARDARDVLCESLGCAPPAPDALLGSLAAVPLPDRTGPAPPPGAPDPLQDALWERGFEVPVVPWPIAPGKRLIRVAAQVYNDLDQYRALAGALRELLP